MAEPNIRDVICDALPLDDQRIALDFIDFLTAHGMNVIRDNGYWKDKIYYLIQFDTEYVCFIAVKDPDDIENRWTVWSDNIGSNWLEDSHIEDSLKETAWEHVDFCGNCGSCGGGKRKVIFGREFDRVCGCTFRIDNPNEKDLPFMKAMVEIRRNEILNIQK